MDRYRACLLCSDRCYRPDRHPVAPESECEGSAGDRFDRIDGDRDADSCGDSDSCGNSGSDCDTDSDSDTDSDCDTDSDRNTNS